MTTSSRQKGKEKETIDSLTAETWHDDVRCVAANVANIYNDRYNNGKNNAHEFVLRAVVSLKRS